MADGIEVLEASVKAAESRLDGVVPVVTALRSTVVELQAQIASLPNQNDRLTALAAELNGHVVAFDSALNPPVPTPEPVAPANDDENVN